MQTQLTMSQNILINVYYTGNTYLDGQYKVDVDRFAINTGIDIPRIDGWFQRPLSIKAVEVPIFDKKMAVFSIALAESGIIGSATWNDLLIFLLDPTDGHFVNIGPDDLADVALVAAR